MPIEFRCSRCQRLLRTGDDTAGKQTKCPECGSILTIPGLTAPSPTMPAQSPAASPAPPGGSAPPSRPVNPFAASTRGGGGAATGSSPGSPAGFPTPGIPAAQATPGAAGGPAPANPFGGPSSPFGGQAGFGGQAPPNFGGLPPVDSGNPYASPMAQPWSPGPQYSNIMRGYTPSIIDVGDVVGRAWTIFTQRIGPCLLAMLILALILIAYLVVVGILIGVIVGIGAAGAGGGGGPGPEFGIIMTVAILFATLLFVPIWFWLMTGYHVFILKIARGEPHAYGDLFAAGPYFGRFLVVAFVFFLLVGIGTLFCIVPGAIFYAMFAQAMWLVIDRNAGIGEALGRSKDLSNNNLLNLCLLWLIMQGINMGIQLVGMVIPLVPLLAVIFVQPFISLMWAVAYLRITGQSTADMLQPGLAPPMAPRTV